ncbi:hypothetical protein [Staphylococcus epidermidis]|nr:hypothetical protein [Staphylococcus epidermidis]
MIVIEGGGGIGVGMYEYSEDFYMRRDLIKERWDLIVSVLG